MNELAFYAGATLSLLAAMIHLWAMPVHFEEWWGYGTFFLAAAACQGLYAVALLYRPGRRLVWLGIGANLALVSIYAMTRTVGIPFFGPHAGMVEEAGALDLLCVAAELSLVAALVGLAGALRAARRYLALGAVQAFGTIALLHLLHSGIHGVHDINPVAHWLQSSVLSMPLSVLAVWISAAISRRFVAFFYGEGAEGLPSRLTWALTSAALYAATSVPADRDAGVVLGGAFLLLFVALRGAPRPVEFWRPRAAATVAGLAAGVLVVAGPTLLGSIFAPSANAQASGMCTAATYDRSYDVAAVDVEIPYNRWGGTNSDPDGQVFVLQGDKTAMKNWWVPLGENPDGTPDPNDDNRRLRPRPLVIRANEGECVKVTLTNELAYDQGDGLPNDPRVGMKVYGPSYDAQTSDGSAVGYNADTTVGRGQTISYYWKAPSEEGTFIFRDQAVMSGSEANSGSTAHGLYGAFVVEPAGSTWRDPETGRPLYAGTTNHDRITKQSGDPYVAADIVPAAGPAFRESVQISQDELPGGNGFSFNYGAEPLGNREANRVPDGIGEETWLSSWTGGDPALIKLASGKGPWMPDPQNTDNAEDCGLPTSCYVSNVTHAYPHDPTKIRFAHAGVKETHVFHMHAHQWRVEPEDRNSTIIDSQTYGPGEAFTAELLFGAGSQPGTIGDSIFHCHLYPHFADGFWALFRVHDVREDGTNKTPDGVTVRNLEPLPDQTPLSRATPDNPGYPRFMPGEFGWRAPQPPKGISEPSGMPDNSTTVAREDLKAATRVVAGRPLDSTLDANDPVEADLTEKLRLEQNAVQPNANPGAPFAEPCLPGSREVTYNVSMIQTDVVYNEGGDHDTQGRLMVLEKDLVKDANGDVVLDAKGNPRLKTDTEPFFFRVNAGDCINFNLTNRLPNWIGNDAFLQTIQTNMVGQHIHLVKFDVLASDGSSNGWNYQQAAFSKEQMEFNKTLDANGNAQNCDSVSCRLEDPAAWDPNVGHGAAPGQTITERWYADTELRTVFTHDHHFAAEDQNRGLFGALIVEPRGMDFRNPKTGAFYQPGNGSTPGAPSCGNECTGTAAGTAMDIIGPGPSDDFREFGLAIQDFASLTKKDGNSASAAGTINAPAAPEHYPDDDPGTMAINYRNAPFSLRQTDKNGNPSDPAHVFSSTVHGDPETPILEAYSEDPVKVRLIQGSQEEQHSLTVHGMRWRQEPDDPRSPLINSKSIGISEAFNFEVPKIVCGPNDETCAGDYLYSGTSTDDLYLGAWGILRARGKEVPTLLPLPDNSLTSATNPSSPTTMQEQLEGDPLGMTAPPEAGSPGNPCPAGAPVKKFEVVAMQADLQYNKYGDHDPFGLIYALSEPGETPEQTVARVRAEDRHEPLVLRANEGDCIEVGLTNKLTPEWLQGHPNAGTNGDPTLPMEPPEGTRSGLRVSLHPQLVKYDVRGSDGTAVGYNRDQTVGPGDRRLYRWYADRELGTTNLTDFGDVRGHRHHGLFAGLNIEPAGSTYHDPLTGEQTRSGVSADIRVPGPDNDFREFTTFFQDGLNLRDKTGAPIKDPHDHPPTPEEPVPAGLDAEDQGEKGFNYTNAPFEHRLPAEQMEPDGIHALPHDSRAMADVFSSRVHGDPDTPIFRAYAGDRIRMRVLQGSDKPRQHSFQVSGASWKAQPEDPNSNVIGTQGGITVGSAFNVQLAGFGSPGDYRYGCGVGFFHLSGGLWGLVRVYPQPQAGVAALHPTQIGGVDNPLAGGHPIMPLEIVEKVSSLSLKAAPQTVTFGQATTLSGQLTAGGAPLPGKQLILEQKRHGASVTTYTQVGAARNTNANGGFAFPVKPEAHTDYRVRFAGDVENSIRASSAETQVKVRALVSTKLGAPTLRPGQRQTISGAVSPVHSGTVTLVIKRDGKPFLSKSLPLSGSRYSFSYPMRGVGNYSVVVSFAGDADHLGQQSPTGTFRVIR